VPITVGDHTLVVAPIAQFGFLTLETDARTISIVFKTADGDGVATRDSVIVDLRAGKILLAGQPLPVAAIGGAAKRKGKSRAAPAKKAKKRTARGKK
jgi:hypothetical protein